MRIVFGLCVAAAALATAAAADAQQKVRWKMPSSFAGTLDVVGEGGPRVQKMMDRLSGGAFELKFFEPNALVPPLQVFDPVSQGSVEAAWTTPGFHAGKIPSAPIFTTVPFGPGPSEFFAWLNHGGGTEIKDEVYGRYNVRGLHCGVIAPEASGWFRKPINSVEDLRGIKMRFFGLGAKVMEKLGVSTQLIAPGDIYPALELGTIDATELSFPSMDLKMGFHQVAKNYYFPGWHQQSSVTELLVNVDKFKALPENYKAMLETACAENIVWSMSASDARQVKALDEIKAKGVTVHRWSPEILAAMRKAWDEVVAAEAAKDPDFKKAWDSYSSFRASYVVWREHGYMN
jgi:TRAP-type mannitol/chloroaromatic compound transport system substrate-binding protein